MVLIPGLGRFPRRRKWQPIPVFLPGKSHGQRNLACRSPWGHKRVRHDSATEQQTKLWCSVGHCYSVAKSCPTLCEPLDCSTLGFPVHHNSQSLLKLMSIKSMMPSNHLILCGPLLLLSSILPSIRVFPMSWLFASGGQSIGASASVLPINIKFNFL